MFVSIQQINFVIYSTMSLILGSLLLLHTLYIICLSSNIIKIYIKFSILEASAYNMLYLLHFSSLVDVLGCLLNIPVITILLSELSFVYFV